MIFLEAFLWGTGLSLGMCVGLVAWIFLKAAAYKILGIAADLERHLQLGVASLAALESRNELTVETNEWMESIAHAMELKAGVDISE